MQLSRSRATQVTASSRVHTSKRIYIAFKHTHLTHHLGLTQFFRLCNAANQNQRARPMVSLLFSKSATRPQGKALDCLRAFNATVVVVFVVSHCMCVFYLRQAPHTHTHAITLAFTPFTLLKGNLVLFVHTPIASTKVTDAKCIHFHSINKTLYI